MLKSFLAFQDDSEPARAALDAACHLAGLVGGKLYLARCVEPLLDPALTAGLMAGSSEFLTAMPAPQPSEDFNRAREARLDEARAQLRRVAADCAERGIPAESLLVAGLPEEGLAERIGLVDLLVVGRPPLDRPAGEPESPAAASERLALTLLRTTKQPVLVTRPPFEPWSELVLLYKPCDRALHALALAVDLAAASRLPLGIVTAAPDEGTAAEMQAPACQYLADHGVACTPHLLAGPGDADEQLVGWLAGRPRSLVLMGAFGRSWMRQLISGGTTRALLRMTRHPLLFTH